MKPSRSPEPLASGLSLIELMVAMVIGSILVLGVVQVFSASRTAYQLSQGIARNQENGRFAMDFLARDLRMVGYMGCMNDQTLLMSEAGKVTGGNVRSLFLSKADRDANNVGNQPFPLRFDASIQGFEAKGTAPGNSLTLPTTPVIGAAEDWSPALPTELASLGIVKGTDVVVLRYLSPESALVTGFDASASPAITYPSEASGNGWKVVTEGHGLYAIGNCATVTVFQGGAWNETGISVFKSGLNKSALTETSSNDDESSYQPNQAHIYRAESVAYYIGLKDGVPALYKTRWTSSAGASALTRQTEELVDGVESMQLLYGEDSAALTAKKPDGYIAKTNTAAVIGGIADAAQALRWRRVGAVQVGFLVRSTDRAAADQIQQQVLQLGIKGPDDGNYRSVYETTVALRNRLFGN